MKSETWIFAICTFFFVLVAPAYWLVTSDPTGTSALVMTALLTTLVSFYLGFHATRMEPRPEDRKDGEIADGAGELGFFSPHSWWPLLIALSASTTAVGIGLWLPWLIVAGVCFVLATVAGLTFEYYTGPE